MCFNAINNSELCKIRVIYSGLWYHSHNQPKSHFFLTMASSSSSNNHTASPTLPLTNSSGLITIKLTRANYLLWRAQIHSRFFCFKDLKTRKVLLHGQTKEGLYLLSSQSQSPSSKAAFSRGASFYWNLALQTWSSSFSSSYLYFLINSLFQITNLFLFVTHVSKQNFTNFPFIYLYLTPLMF